MLGSCAGEKNRPWTLDLGPVLVKKIDLGPSTMEFGISQPLKC